MATIEQTKKIEDVASAFTTEDPTQQAAVDAVKAAFGGEDTPVKPLDTPVTPVVTPTERFSRLTDVETKAEETLAAPLDTETTAEIQARKTTEAQAEIDAINNLFAGKIREQGVENVARERETASVSTLTGLGGSTEANVVARSTRDLGAKEIEAIQNEQAVAIQGILSGVRQSAVDEAATQREEARQAAGDVLALRVSRQTEAVGNVQLLAGTGVTAEGLKEGDPESYNYLVKTLGGENEVKGYFTLNRPVDTIIDKKIEGGKYIIAYQNPLTGETRVETVDLDLPANYSKTIDAGDRIVAIPDDWDGDPSNLITINKGIDPEKVGGGSTDGQSAAEGTAEDIMNGIGSLKDVSINDGRRDVMSILSDKFTEAKSSGDLLGTMRASAVFDKVPSDTFTQSFDKMTNVLGQLGVLQENLVAGFDDEKIEGVKTGPLVGALKAANPWSTEGQVIKAQLNAIVPNLARGVYGEVGVLTDNDIRTYQKTIPNLSSTEDIRNAVLYITVDMIRKSMESKIAGQAAAQRDMSQYSEIYHNLTTQANDILANINQGTEKEDAYADFRTQLEENEILIQRGEDVMAVPEEEIEDNDVRL